jgi:deoxycytidylate deaminase
MIVSESGDVVTGENYCRDAQQSCPREEGEGYEKCRSICQQVGHAEEVALVRAKHAGMALEGARAVLIGHEYACTDCQKQLYDAGIRWIGRSEIVRL